VQKASLGLKAQSTHQLTTKKVNTKKKPGAAVDTQRSVRARDLGCLIKIERPRLTDPDQGSGVALHQAKHTPKSSSPSDRI
jgi:hypothetical protein